MYCLTIIVDRFSRWPEAVRIPDVSVETIVRALYTGWISRYGIPDFVTTDQGRQFEAALFKSFSLLLGFKRVRTSAYHPAANGLIDRFHRPLKATIKAHGTERWVEMLPTVLFGFRATLKEDLGTITFRNSIRIYYSVTW